MERTFASTITAIAKVFVARHVFRANVTLRIATFRAGHLVAAILLNKGILAAIAVSNESFRLGLLNRMSNCKLFILLDLLASLRNMCLLLTKSAADLLAFWAQTPKLPVYFDRKTLSFEVAEGTLLKKIQACCA